MRHSDKPLDERIVIAHSRITSGQAAMRVPPEATDPDIVLSACHGEITQLRSRIEALEALLRDCRDFVANPWNPYHATALAAMTNRIDEALGVPPCPSCGVRAHPRHLRGSGCLDCIQAGDKALGAPDA